MGQIFNRLLLGTTLALSGMPVLSADLNHGAAVYSGVCAKCHGVNPRDNVYHVLTGADNPAIIQSFIDNTFPMQSLSYLSTADVADVAAYLGSVVAPPAVTPQSGYWWNPAEGGRGFTIELNSASGKVFFAAFLYATSGSPAWYAAGPVAMSGAIFSAPMTAYSNGQTLTGAYQQAMQGASPGNLSITFSDNDPRPDQIIALLRSTLDGLRIRGRK